MSHFPDKLQSAEINLYHKNNWKVKFCKRNKQLIIILIELLLSCVLVPSLTIHYISSNPSYPRWKWIWRAHQGNDRVLEFCWLITKKIKTSFIEFFINVFYMSPALLHLQIFLILLYLSIFHMQYLLHQILHFFGPICNFLAAIITFENEFILVDLKPFHWWLLNH